MNADATRSILDLFAMQKYLHGAGKLKDPATADLYADSILDIFDLPFMKQKLLQKQ